MARIEGREIGDRARARRQISDVFDGERPHIIRVALSDSPGTGTLPAIGAMSIVNPPWGVSV